MCIDGIERSLYDIFMDGNLGLLLFHNRCTEAVKEYLELNGKRTEEYDCLAFHQANRFILKSRLHAKDEGSEGKARSDLTGSFRQYGRDVDSADTQAIILGTQRMGKKNILMSGFGDRGQSWGVTSAAVDTEKIFPVIRTKDFLRGGKFEPGAY